MPNTNGGWFTTQNRTINGNNVQVWVLNQSHWATSPYFELVGATRDQAQNFENLLIGKIYGSSNTLPASNLLTEFLALQRAVPVDNSPSGVKVKEPNGRGVYILLDYIGVVDAPLSPGIGAELSGKYYFEVPSGSQNFAVLAGDKDSKDPDVFIKINSMIQTTAGPKAVWTSGIQYKNSGIVNWEAAEQINLLHELAHLQLKETYSARVHGPLLPNSNNPSWNLTGHDPFMAALQRSAAGTALSAIDVEDVDVRKDPIEMRVFQQATERGLISNATTYWAARARAYKTQFDSLKSNFSTREQMLQYFNDEVAFLQKVDAVAALRQAWDLAGDRAIAAQRAAAADPSNAALKQASEEADAALEKAVQDYQKSKAELNSDPRSATYSLREMIIRIDEPGIVTRFVAWILDLSKDFFSKYSAGIGQIFGSTLGRLIAQNENQAVQITSSTVLGVVGMNIGQEIQISLLGDKAPSSLKGFEDLPADLKNASIGAISSFLTAELFEALGIDGVAGELGTSIFSSSLTAIVQNLDALRLPAGAAGAKSLGDVLNGVQIGNIIGGYLGTKLASELVQFDTIAGQVGAQLGAAIGAFVGAGMATAGAEAGAEVGTSIAGPVGAFIGAFVGFIVGGLIGSLFGTTPQAGADVTWNSDQRRFVAGNAWSRGGAPKESAVSIATAAAETINGIVVATGAYIADGSYVQAGSYGTRKKSYVYRHNGQITFKTKDFSELMRYGATNAIAGILPQLVGGDVFVKRAMIATMPQGGSMLDFEVLYGNMAVARDYTAYRKDSQIIDVLIAAQPNSAFAAGWAITFARAIELGLLKRAYTDWSGGWNVFLDDKFDSSINGQAYTAGVVDFRVNTIDNERLTAFYSPDWRVDNVVGDTIETASKDKIVGTTGDDTIVVAGDRIQDTTNLTINDVTATGAEHVIDVAATIFAGDGNDTIISGDLGNDLIGGQGNDTLVGGKLDDWLFGEEGGDRLFAGASNYNFTDGDANATTAALQTVSNGDMLDGGAGNDFLYGSKGSDFLRGGDGNDTIYGGAGGDIIDGGAGDDVGPNGEAKLFGGAGTDQYVFGFGSGKDVVFDESDNFVAPGGTGNTLYDRMQALIAGTIARNWAGGGDYEVDGSVKGGEDAISFGPGISYDNLIIRRSGTDAAPGQDLIIQLKALDPDTNAYLLTGDELVIKDWFEGTRRVEWMRFANGDEVRLGDISSTLVGTNANDVILGTYASDFIAGGDGDDKIFGLTGNDYGFGGRGDDFVSGDEDNDCVSGGNDNDIVVGGDGHDTVLGDGGNDFVYGGGGWDIVAGGRGNDTVVGGDGDDIFEYARGDGRDVVIDAYVDNWEVVWQSGVYQNGYVVDAATGAVSKAGVTYFDGTKWLGTYEYFDQSKTLRRHLGAVNGALTANSGQDALEFGVGIDIQDLMLHRNGNDLQIAIGRDDNDPRSFDSIDDQITLKDWYLTGPNIEVVTFVATGVQSTASMNGSGTEAADNIVGTASTDWITGNSGDDIVSGGDGGDILSGNSGNDTLIGGLGTDVLYGGIGNDVLEGSEGADYLIGGHGIDIASYANATNTGIRAFLNAPITNTKDAIGDVYSNIEGLEGTSGADKLGGTDDENVLRGLAGNDTLYGGAGDDVYEINASNGQDTIVDAPFATEEVLFQDGTLNTAQFTASWTYIGMAGSRESYRLVVTSNASGQEVYRSRDGVDFLYTAALLPPRGPGPGQRAMPASTSWPSSNSQWLFGAARTGNSNQVAREAISSGNGGDDTLQFGANISLSDLTVTRQNSGTDLRIQYSSGNHVTMTGQTDPNRAVESLQLADGLTVDLTRVVLVGETASAEGDFVVGDGNANTLDGLAGDDVISGLAGADTLRGGDGDDTLEGGAGGDTLDGGNDSVTAGLLPDANDNTKAYGDTIRYVRSTAAVNINLAAGTASGGQAASDVIVKDANNVSTIENVVGSEGFGDTLQGDARANRLFGLGGNDALIGNAGNDVLVGGLGDDALTGGDGEDNLAGQEGNDTLAGGNDKDLLAGGGGNDSLNGDAGDDILSGGDGDDIVRGGADNDQLGGDSGIDQLYGDAGDDQIAGGDGTDTLYGGDGNDVFAGEGGNDTLYGEAGNDTYVYDAESGSDVIIDASGTNKIALVNVTRDQIWLNRSGNDLIVSVIGGNTSITIQNYYAATTPTLIREIALANESLFLSAAQGFIDAMVAQSATIPASMPIALNNLLDVYWHLGGKSAPTVVDQSFSTNNITVVSGSVGAIDHDQNIVNYAVSTDSSKGLVVLDPATGNWTYSPFVTDSGEDFFQVSVTDADGNTATQTIMIDVAPTELALPPIINVAQYGLPQAPLTKPTLDSGSWIVHIQGQLADTDRSEDLNVRVSNVPNGFSFNTGTNLGGGVWDFGAGPWPTLMYGPTTWSQDLSLLITATSREKINGLIASATPVTLNIEINARPTDIGAGSLSFNENAAAGTALTNLSTIDADAGDIASYALVSGFDAGGRFTLDSNGVLRAGSVGTNYEASTSHVIRVQATDSGGLTYTKDLIVSVVNVNEAPMVTAQVKNTNEDTIVTGSVGASDPDNNISSYALATNAIRGSVSLNASTGSWTYTPTANLYGADSFQIRVTDAGGLTAVQTVSISVASINDAPTNITLTGAPSGIDERDRPMTGFILNAVVLGTLSATDVDAPDAGDFASHTFTVSDSRFEVVSGNVLRLKAGAALDFETATSVTFNVTATDRNGTGLSFVKAFTFSVNNQDDYFYGTTGNDTITGTANRNLIYGQAGNDTLTGANANDDLDGGDGVDQLSGQDGNDVLIGGLGDDTLDGGTGNDTLSGGDGFDTLRGRDGNDTLNGEIGNDLLQGGLHDDQLDGGADNDQLEGGDGNDRLVGNTGDDALLGGLGADHFLGGAGIDTVSYEAAAAGITINLATGTGTGGEANGDIFEDTPEKIIGSGFTDNIIGSNGDDTIDGGAGDDTIYGGTGNDWLIGGAGNDTLDAQAGNDTLDGGTGNDILIGGDDSDTYLMDINSGSDEIRNFDPNGTDIDVVGYQSINNNQLWFQRSGNDLIVSVVGTTVSTSIKDWYVVTSAADRSNYKIDFFLSGIHSTKTINAEALVTLMAGYTKPTTQAAYDTLHANTTFETQWGAAWGLNAPPSVATITSQSINEDGSLNIIVRITDDITPVTGITTTVDAVSTTDYNVQDLSKVNAPTISAPNAAGDRSLIVNTKPNASGQVAIKIRATDAGGLTTQQVFLLTINAVADAPALTVVQAVTPTAPLTQPSFDGGFWSLNIQAALTDQDGSETLEVRIANVPTGITFNAGTNQGSGVWSFTPAQLSGLRVQGPTTWSQDLALSVTAISRETSTGLTATSAATPFNVVINARPTDIAADRALTFGENIEAGTGLAWFSRTDADAGDTATYSIVNDAGGRYAVRSDGLLMAGSVSTNYEAATSHTIRVRVTDAGGLSYDKDFTINVANINEAPIDIAADRVLSFNENYAPGTGLAWFSRTDVDVGDSATYSIVNDAGGRYAVRSDGLLMAGSMSTNYEAASSHTIRVRVTDAGGLSYDKDFTVNVININEAPTDISADRALSFYENYAPGTGLAWFGRSDVDVGDSATYSIVPGYDAGGRFAVRNDGLLYVGTTPNDYEAGNSFSIKVQVIDSGGLTYTKDFGISLVNLNESPTDIYADRALSFSEGYAPGTGLAWFGRSDVDAGDTATYSIVNDAGGRYAVRSDGLLMAGGVLTDSESSTSHTIRVRVTDASGSYYDEDFVIGVLNVNEAPTMSGATFSIAENSIGFGSTTVGAVSGSDPEGQSLIYSVVSGDTAAFTPGASQKFSLNQSTGQILLQGDLDYETKSSYQVQVSASDGSLSSTNLLTINVVNSNEQPVIDSFGEQDGYLKLYAHDPEGSALTYQVISAWESIGGGTITFFITSFGGGWWTSVDPTRLSIDSTGKMLFSYSPVQIDFPVYYEEIHPFTAPAGFHATIRVTDLTGAYTDVQVTQDIVWTDILWGVYYQNYYIDPNWHPPVVMDLDGDGLELISAATSKVKFAATSGLTPLVTGWVGSDDAFLALDRDHDGAITNFSEVSFVQDLAGAKSDLEGLVAYDTNHNGLLDDGDTQFGDFLVWRDANQDGISQADEMKSLADHNIQSINLTRDVTGESTETATDNVILATSEFVRTDGTTGQVGDVVLGSGTMAQIASSVNEVPALTITDTLDLDEWQREAGLASSASDEPYEVEEVAAPTITDTLDLNEWLGKDSVTSVSQARLPKEMDDGVGTSTITDTFDMDQLLGNVNRKADDQSRTFKSSRSVPTHDKDVDVLPQRAESDTQFEMSNIKESAPLKRSDEPSDDEDKSFATPNSLAEEDSVDSQIFAATTRGALHARLSLISKNRLQMIEAMATFEAEGTTGLDLRPHRHVDAKTLELLTSVSSTRYTT
jgi:Ca2+-binding RTX toxin-like protein